MAERGGWGLVIALLALGAAPAAGQDVCAIESDAINATVEQGAAEIASAYAAAGQSLWLNSAAAPARACNWDCGSDRVTTQFQNAFGLLRYHCRRTNAGEWTRRPTGSGTASQMGLSITDAQYRDLTDAIFRSGDSGVGALMLVPSALEEASKSGDVQAVIDAVGTLPGATWLKFSSTSVNNDGSGAARILVRVPDAQDPPRFEQWIQIAITPTGSLGRNVDFLALQHESDESSPLGEEKLVAFRGYSRTAAGFEPEGLGGRSELSKCYSCHPSGLRPVIPAPAGSIAVDGRRAIPVEGTMLATTSSEGDALTFEQQLAALEALTSTRARFGPSGFEASENGPLFGPSERLGRPEFVAAGCARGLSDERRQAIVDHMDCETCHDGGTRGVLNAATSLATIRHKVVENQVAPMPPGSSLSAADRAILFRCLQTEYAEILRHWITRDLLEPF